MNTRDYDYIETRLLTPDLKGSEACGRLIQNGHADLASRIMEASATYLDVCRSVRYELADKDRRGL